MDRERAIFVQIPTFNDPGARAVSNEVQAIVASRVLEVAVEQGLLTSDFVQRQIMEVEQRLASESNMVVLGTRYENTQPFFRGTRYLSGRIGRISTPGFLASIVRRVAHG